MFDIVVFALAILVVIRYFRRSDFIMAMAYATLIIKGKKTFNDVPDRLKEQVKEILYDLDCGWMIDG